MHELTVSMPAFRAAPFIERAMSSVLREPDVDLELIVVDDGSDDGTARVAEGCGDRRVRVLSNPARRGIGHCHNRVIRECRSAFIAHVDADDFVLPGALRAMLDAARASESAGQLFCDFFPVDPAGDTTPAARERWLERLSETRDRMHDIRRALIVHGMVVNHLRTYPRAVFDVVGGFDEGMAWGVDFEMALRIADRFEIVRVPRPLYAKRLHPASTTEWLSWPGLRFWWSRYRTCGRLRRAAGGRLLGRGPIGLHGLMLLGLAHVLLAPLESAGVRRPAALRPVPPA